MDNSILGTRKVTQIGIIVKDIEKTAEAYAHFFGIQKPGIVVTDIFDKAHTEYEGKPTQARAKLAFINVGESLDLELIEPDHEPSTWRNFLDTHGEGVHHIAFVVKDMDEKIASLEESSIPLQQKGDYEGGRYAYMNSSEQLKVIIELLENF